MKYRDRSGDSANCDCDISALRYPAVARKHDEVGHLKSDPCRVEKDQINPVKDADRVPEPAGDCSQKKVGWQSRESFSRSYSGGTSRAGRLHLIYSIRAPRAAYLRGKSFASEESVKQTARRQKSCQQLRDRPPLKSTTYKVSADRPVQHVKATLDVRRKITYAPAALEGGCCGAPARQRSSRRSGQSEDSVDCRRTLLGDRRTTYPPSNNGKDRKALLAYLRRRN